MIIDSKYRKTDNLIEVIDALSHFFSTEVEFFMWQKSKKYTFKMEIINLELKEFTLRGKDEILGLNYLSEEPLYIISTDYKNAFKADIKNISGKLLTCFVPVEIFLEEKRQETRKYFSDLVNRPEILAKLKSTVLTFHNARINDYSESGLSISINRKHSSSLSPKDSIMVHSNDLTVINGTYSMIYKRSDGFEKVRLGLKKRS